MVKDVFFVLVVLVFIVYGFYACYHYFKFPEKCAYRCSAINAESWVKANGDFGQTCYCKTGGNWEIQRSE